WDTGQRTDGELYVSRNGEPEVLVARLPSGSLEVSWIDPQSTYVFRLYLGHEHQLVLAALTVSGDALGLVSPEEWAELVSQWGWRSDPPAPSPDFALAAFGIPALLLCGLLASAAWYVHGRGQAEAASRLLIVLAGVSIALSAGSPWAVEPR